MTSPPQALLLVRLGYLREVALRSLLRRSDLSLALLDEHSSSLLHAADHALPVADVHDEPAVLDVARRYLRRHGAAGVLTFQDSSLGVLSQLASEFDLPGWRRETLRRATHKHLTREALAGCGLPCPRYAVAGSEREAAAALEAVGLPAVMKPTDRSAGRGVVVVESAAGAGAAYATARANSLSGAVLVEEFLDGPEVSVESATADGVTRVLAVTGKVTSGGTACVEMGHVVPAPLPPAQERAVRDLVRDALRAIGFERGVAHTEVKVTPCGPQVVEVNARVAGDCISELVDLASGVDLYQVAADLALGRGHTAEEAGPASFHHGAAIRFLSAPPGRVVAVEGADEVARRLDPGCDRMGVLARVGDVVPRLSSNLERVGYVLVRARTAAEAAALAEDCASGIQVRTDASATAARAG